MAEAPPDPQQQALEAIRLLSADYLARLPAKLDEIEAAWQSLRDTPPAGWDLEALRDLHRAVHGVTGSGRIFGLPEVSAAARTLEAELQALIDAQAGERADGCARATLCLSHLRRVAAGAGPLAA